MAQQTPCALSIFRGIPSNNLPTHSCSRSWRQLPVAVVSSTRRPERSEAPYAHNEAGPRGSPWAPAAARRSQRRTWLTPSLAVLQTSSGLTTHSWGEGEKGDVDGEARLEVDGSAGASLQSLCGRPRHSLLLTSRFQGPPPPPPKQSKAKP